MQHVKYAWDKLFLFLIALSAVILLISWIVPLEASTLQMIHALNLLILAGYYFFFIRDLRFAKKKLAYCKQHWVLLLLLIVPLIPFSQIFTFFNAKSAISLGQNVAWWALDEAGML